MKRKILKSLSLISAVTILLTAVLVSFVLYGEFYERTKSEVRREANYVAALVNSSDTAVKSTLDSVGKDNRITLISNDGTVLYDNTEDKDKMSNHSDRPEIQRAVQSGIGEITRKSDTVGKKTFYYAVRLENGQVLRIAATTDTVFAATASCIPYMLMIAVIMFSLALAMSNLQTAAIVRPINSLDLSDPLSNDTYEELTPLLRSLSDRNRRIEEQKAALNHRNDEFANITENMKEGLIMVSSSANVLYINNSACNIFYVEADSVTGKHLLSINRSDAMIEAADKIAHGKHFDKILPLYGRAYQFTSTPVLSGTASGGAVLLITDITERYESEQLRREFSANVSHELKTPLTSISGYAEIIENGIAKPEDIAGFAGKIKFESARLLTLVEDIIHLSQLDEGSPSLQFEPVDLHEICVNVAERLDEKAQKSDVTISVSGDSAEIKGVKRVLDEMIYNLCENAVKYNKPGGSVTVSTKLESDKVVLSVSDTGIGIPKEHQERVFERFYCVDKSHSRQSGGTGLGLSIVKNAAKLHNASISLTSTENVGTTITVTFEI